MRPNGVFYLAGEVAGILETRLFIKQGPQVDFATQSRPMLVRGGEVNARFVRNGGSRKYRVGVGSRDPNLVVFAISESEISFDEFARLFRDKLRRNNALFLDGGSATSFYSPVLGRNTNFLPLGPIIGVYGGGERRRTATGYFEVSRRDAGCSLHRLCYTREDAAQRHNDGAVSVEHNCCFTVALSGTGRDRLVRRFECERRWNSMRG
jgi:Phosphodiester glycosidase